MTPPIVVYQFPFIVYPFVTSLPTVDNITGGIPALSVNFSEPVNGVQGSDLIVNDSPATEVTGEGEGPYIFSGFEPPGLGTIQVLLSSGSIVDSDGEQFEGDSWEYTMVDESADSDEDGANDGQEVNLFRTNPTRLDSDNDSMPDGFETSTSCLNPLLDDSHVMDMAGNIVGGPRDADGDGISNIEEFTSGSDPCPPISTPPTPSPTIPPTPLPTIPPTPLPTIPPTPLPTIPPTPLPQGEECDPSAPTISQAKKSTGPLVERLQRLLIERGFDPGVVDGIFGPITKKAVIEFQKANSLLVDGIVGPQTWGALCSTLPVT